MEPGDAPSVSAILQEAFDQRLHPYIAYCQPGLRHYLVDSLHHGGHEADGVIQQVATDANGRVAGYAKITSRGSEPPTLSYLSVAAAHRRRGLAGSLISAAAARLCDRRALELDVFADNQPALKFYARLGAKPIAQTCWWAADSRSVPNRLPSGWALENVENTRVALDRYGFCQPIVSSGPGSKRLNLPSRSVVRIPDTEPSTLSSTLALEALTRVTTFLAVAPDSPEQHCGGSWRPVVGAVRLAICPPADGERDLHT